MINNNPQKVYRPSSYFVGPLNVNTETRCISFVFDGNEIPISSSELRALDMLRARAGRRVGLETLYTEIWQGKCGIEAARSELAGLASKINRLGEGFVWIEDNQGGYALNKRWGQDWRTARAKDNIAGRRPIARLRRRPGKITKTIGGFAALFAAALIIAVVSPYFSPQFSSDPAEHPADIDGYVEIIDAQIPLAAAPSSEGCAVLEFVNPAGSTCWLKIEIGLYESDLIAPGESVKFISEAGARNLVICIRAYTYGSDVSAGEASFENLIHLRGDCYDCDK